MLHLDVCPRVTVARAQYAIVLVGDGRNQSNEVRNLAYTGQELDVDQYASQNEVL